MSRSLLRVPLSVLLRIGENSHDLQGVYRLRRETRLIGVVLLREEPFRPIGCLPRSALLDAANRAEVSIGLGSRNWKTDLSIRILWVCRTRSQTGAKRQQDARKGVKSLLEHRIQDVRILLEGRNQDAMSQDARSQDARSTLGVKC